MTIGGVNVDLQAVGLAAIGIWQAFKEWRSRRGRAAEAARHAAQAEATAKLAHAGHQLARKLDSVLADPTQPSGRTRCRFEFAPEPGIASSARLRCRLAAGHEGPHLP